MKYLKYILMLSIASLCFIFIDNVYAYAVVDTNYGYFYPSGVDSLDWGREWGTWGNTYDKDSPWLYSLGYYWSAGDVKGSHITINADYELGIKCEGYSDCHVENYLNSAQNSLKASNLRCGIGDYKTGYNSTYSPKITNFQTHFLQDDDFLGSQYIIHVRFTYNQDIPETIKNNTNMSCWFERNPSNGLFAQTIKGLYNTSAHYYYASSLFQYAVTEDPNTNILIDITNQGKKTNEKLDEIKDQNDAIINNGDATNNKLDGIQDQNDYIINNGNATNNKLDEVNGNITDTDTSGAQDSANNFFNGFQDSDYGLSGVITSPLNIIKGLSSGTCVPLSFPAPFVDQDITLPCLTPIYQQHFGSFLTIYQTITFGIISYWVCINIFRMVKNFKNPDNDEIEVLDL